MGVLPEPAKRLRVGRAAKCAPLRSERNEVNNGLVMKQLMLMKTTLSRVMAVCGAMAFLTTAHATLFDYDPFTLTDGPSGLPSQRFYYLTNNAN